MNKITPVPGPSQADFDALNGKITNLNIINLSSSTSIASLCASCPNGEHRYYGATVSTTFSDFPSAYGTLYHPIVHIIKRVNGNEIIINAVSGTNTPTQINGWFENNTFKWEKLALDSRFISHEVIIGSSVNVSYTYAYPTGLSASNSVIVGYTAYAANGFWYTNSSGIYVGGNTRDGITVKFTDSDFANQKLEILFAKL